MILRKATSTDIARIKELYDDEWYYAFLDDPHYTKIVCCDEDLLGVIALSITLGTANIDWIWVQDSARLKGIGSELLCEAFSWAKGKEGRRHWSKLL